MKMAEKHQISIRSSRYLECLKNELRNGAEYISAERIAEQLGISKAFVQRDLIRLHAVDDPNGICKITTMIRLLHQWLNREYTLTAVLVGAGHLGRALLEYIGGTEYADVRIKAAFDVCAAAGEYAGDIEVLPLHTFEDFCAQNRPQIGIITVPQGEAQTVCDRMVDNGITAIWNLAPVRLQVPEGVLLMREDLGRSLMTFRTQIRTAEIQNWVRTQRRGKVR